MTDIQFRGPSFYSYSLVSNVYRHKLVVLWHLHQKKNEILYFGIKGGYLEFSHHAKLKNIYVTEIYMKKQYKSSVIKNHKI